MNLFVASEFTYTEKSDLWVLVITDACSMLKAKAHQNNCMVNAIPHSDNGIGMMWAFHAEVFSIHYAMECSQY